MQISFDLQADHLTRALEVIRREIATPAQMLGSIGETLKIVNEERHAKGVAPDGTKWKPLSPMTIGTAVWKSQGDKFRKNGQMSLASAQKVKGRRILYGNGDMLGSFNYQVNGDTLTLGFSDQKALWHHFGTGSYGPKGSPYTILPKTAKALAFGGLVRKRVVHPGIPARPLIGFPGSDATLVGEVIDDHLMLVLNRIR
ncbi:phage virion morphogenesis protein [Herbaspirillum chlorophenolicum]|uniref:phage virion morphogenesis protein n=1 Tax=Herbaspirillum chlorophenolicum TaxID=211589 RepID=UPI00067D5F88|nr:phage virion morphogenesis protein [Herbaspirillum chlorophenolicum]